MATIRLTETIGVHVSGGPEAEKNEVVSKMTEKSKSQMASNGSKKALLEVIPPRNCATFCRGSFSNRPENSKMRFSDDQSQNTIDTGPESLDRFSEKVENHENRSELDTYSTFRVENQAI